MSRIEFIPVIGSMLIIAAFSVIEGANAVFITYILFGSVGLLIASRGGITATRILAVVYAVGVIASVLLYYIYIARYNAPYVGGGSDDLHFEQYGLLLANNSQLLYYDSEAIGTIINSPHHNSKGYVYVISLLVRFGDMTDGFHTMIPRILNCISLAIIAVLVFSILKQLHVKERTASVCALACGMFPIMLWISAHTFRDIIVGLIIITVMRLALIIINNKQQLWKSILATVAILILTVVIMEFRELNIMPIIGIVSTAWFVRLVYKLQRQLLIFLSLIILVTLLFYRQQAYETMIGQMLLSQIDNFTGHRAQLSSGLSTTLFNLPFPLNIPARVCYSVITPLPLLFANIERNFISMGTIIQIIFIPYLLVGIRVTYNNRVMWPLLVGFIILYGGYAFGSFTGRHLAQLIPFAVILIGIGYTNYHKRRIVLLGATLGVIVFLGITYSMVKYIL